MDKKQPNLSDYLTELDWSHKDFCGQLGLHPNTVTNWKGDPPKYARAYLDLACRVTRWRNGMAL